MEENKKRALEAAISKIEKDFGRGAVMRFGDSSSFGEIEVIPTGALSIDIALGLGGIPKGRVVEIYGPESSGKTTVSLQMVAEVQKHGGIAAFIDAEHALDPKYAKNIGVDIDELYISQPDTGGRALKFYASVRMDVRRIDMIKNGGERIGNRTRVKIVKNKIAPPFKEAEFDIIYGTGISREGDILDLAANINVVNKSGSWYSYEGSKIAQGRESTKAYLSEHINILDEIERKVREYYQLQTNGSLVVEGKLKEENFDDISERIEKELEKEEVTTLNYCRD